MTNHKQVNLFIYGIHSYPELFKGGFSLLQVLNRFWLAYVFICTCILIIIKKDIYDFMF